MVVAQATQTTAEVVTWGEQLGALTGPAVLALLILLLLRGDLITKRSHDAVIDRCSNELAKVEAERERWRGVALDALNVTEAAVHRGGG